MGKEFGFRNAQATVIAPTGTIGLVMDCDTTGVEPDFALVKFKTLAGGGYFKIINRCVPEALASLGYTDVEANAIVAYAVGYGSLESFTGRLNLDSLRAKGFGEEQIREIEAALESAFDIRFVFNKWTLGEKFCREVLKLDASGNGRARIRHAESAGFLPRRYGCRQSLCLRRHDPGRRALSQSPSILPCSIAPIPAAAWASGR